MPKVTYTGHSGFAVEHNGTQFLIDPFISSCPTATQKPDDFNPSTILLTHAHGDHVGDTVDIATRTNAKVIAIVELAGYLGKQGVDAVGANLGGTVEFDGGTAKFVPAWHTSTYGDDWNAPSTPAGFIVRFGGQTIYFAGDTCLFGDMKLIGEEGIDIAVLPIGDHFTMGISDAVRAVKFIEPKTVIPCHYDTFPPIKQDANEFKQRVESETFAKCLVLQPGESHES